MSGEPQPTSVLEPKRPWWQRLLGVRRRQGRFPVALTRWGWCLLAFVALGGAMGGFAEYSMQPDFCRSCHLMEPYYQAWHQSTHKNVPCADCHFEPGLMNTIKGKWQASAQAVKFITETYGSKPHAEIRDASCMRSGCHERRVLEGKVDWEVPTQRGGKITIRFDHTPHINEMRRGKQLRCVSCHSQIVQGQHLVVTLDTCFLCHMKGMEHGRNDTTLGGCNSCHEAPKEQIQLATGLFNHSDYINRGVTCENCHSEVVKGDGAVPRQVCWTCHNQTRQVSRYGEVGFLHKAHVTKHKVECGACHLHIEHSLKPGSKETDFAHGGHLGKNAGSCGNCHTQTHLGPDSLYAGAGGRGVPDMPSPMYRAQVDCIACHKERKRTEDAAQVVGQTFMAAQDTCDYCHGTKYEGTLKQWKDTVALQVLQAETAYEQAKAAVDKATMIPAAQLEARRALDDAHHNIRLVKLGHGVHNVNYSTALLNFAMERSQQAGRLAAAAAAAGGAQ